jgi:hypothetical protein
MTIEFTTIREAARGRLAQWTLVARSKDGSRSLPGSLRSTDTDIWSAPISFGETNKRKCGSVKETARPGREDVSIFHRGQLVRYHLSSAKPHPHLLGLRFFAGFPKGEFGVIVDPAMISIKWRRVRVGQKGFIPLCLEPLLDNTHKS